MPRSVRHRLPLSAPPAVWRRCHEPAGRAVRRQRRCRVSRPLPAELRLCRPAGDRRPGTRRGHHARRQHAVDVGPRRGDASRRRPEAAARPRVSQVRSLGRAPARAEGDADAHVHAGLPRRRHRLSRSRLDLDRGQPHGSGQDECHRHRAQVEGRRQHRRERHRPRRPRLHTAIGLARRRAPGAKVFRRRDGGRRLGSGRLHARPHRLEACARILRVARGPDGQRSGAAPRGRGARALRRQPGEPGRRAMRRGLEHGMSRPLPRGLHLQPTPPLRRRRRESCRRDVRPFGRRGLPGTLSAGLYVRAAPVR